MKSGKIISEGNPEQVINPSVLKEVFNIDARIMLDEQTGSPVCYGYDS
jgi:iron complex transport system ATP-binding protein